MVSLFSVIWPFAYIMQLIIEYSYCTNQLAFELVLSDHSHISNSKLNQYQKPLLLRFGSKDGTVTTIKLLISTN